MVIDRKSYADERNELRINNTADFVVRSVAFEALADKEGLEKTLEKTRMCNSVGKGKCHHGNRCRFAHHLDELNIITCFFDHRCRFIEIVAGKVVDYGAKMCTHKHTAESKEEFFTRTGLDRFKGEKPKVVETQQLTKVTDMIPRSVQQHKYDVKHPLAPQPSPKAVPILVLDQEVSDKKLVEEEETVLRVPMELVLKAMEFAMKSGRNRIRIEIV